MNLYEIILVGRSKVGAVQVCSCLGLRNEGDVQGKVFELKQEIASALGAEIIDVSFIENVSTISMEHLELWLEKLKDDRMRPEHVFRSTGGASGGGTGC